MDYYKGKKVLITGGAGFIGSHLARRLVELGAHVTILDNFSTGSVENVRDILDEITVLQFDITSFHQCLRAAFHKSHVFHCAALCSVELAEEKPSLCYHVNVTGTRNMLEACKIHNVSSFVFSSSASVYGDNEHVCKEYMHPAPLSEYAKSKVLGEQLCQTYAKEHEMKIAVLRYFNVYDDALSSSSPHSIAAARFRYQLEHNMPITIYGSGEQTRDFVHIDRVVEANIYLGMYPPMQTEVYNIASGKSITLLEFIEFIEKKTGKKRASVTHLPPRKGDILHSCADISKYSSYLSHCRLEK